MSTALLEVFDLLAYSEQLEARLGAAAAELAKRPGMKEEKAWIALAQERVTAARAGIGDLPLRALRVPELEPMKGDHARGVQGAVLDAFERVHGAIVAAGGARSPLLEALTFKIKMPVLRKSDRGEFEQFCAELEKRLSTSYVKRMLGDADYAVVKAPLDEMLKAIATWRGIFTTPPLSDEEAQPLRDEILACARRLEVPCRQARLLAQAALAPLRLLDDHGVSQRPKRRGPKPEMDEDTHPVLEQDPPDPRAPTPEEQAELDAATSPTPAAPPVKESARDVEGDKPRRGKPKPAEA